tara:strand:- start:124 stop:1146 length:1023 start_codon:yes stop_codon:yes gene_type:complete
MSTALTDDSKINLSFKKVLGKAQTSNTKELSNEAIGSNISIGASTIFGYQPPAAVSSSFYTILNGKAEKVRLNATPIEGTKDSNGRYQAFALSLPSNYEARSSNPQAGSGMFINGKILNETTGTLQIIPPSFGINYTALVYHTSSGETQIPALDARDWVLDYFNGVYFQQDPPSDISENPAYVDAFIYISDYAVARLSGSGGSPGGAANDIQFNSGGSFTGSAKLTFDSTTLAVKARSHLSGGVSFKRTKVTTSYSITTSDYYLGVDTTSSPVTLTIPAASTVTEGQTFVVKDEGGNTAANAITLSCSAAETMDGLTTTTITSPYGSVSMYTDGTNWFIY